MKGHAESERGRILRSRWVKAILALAAAGILCFAVLLGIVLNGAYDHIQGEPRVMVVLGCKVQPWGQPSTLLQNRLDEALEYLKEHPDMTVVVSGGQGPNEPMTEAESMSRYLMERGVPEHRILLEDRSHNTIQNLRMTKLVLEEAGVDYSGGILIVSNGFHLTRSRMLAGRAGFEHVSTLAAPATHMPSRLKMYIREPIALVKSLLLDQ